MCNKATTSHESHIRIPSGNNLIYAKIFQHFLVNFNGTSFLGPTLDVRLCVCVCVLCVYLSRAVCCRILSSSAFAVDDVGAPFLLLFCSNFLDKSANNSYKLTGFFFPSLHLLLWSYRNKFLRIILTLSSIPYWMIREKLRYT